jgi:hypothetical protein
MRQVASEWRNNDLRSPTGRQQSKRLETVPTVLAMCAKRNPRLNAKLRGDLMVDCVLVSSCASVI